MSVIGSYLKGLQTSKTSDSRWQTTPDESDSFSVNKLRLIFMRLTYNCIDYL